MVFFISIAQWAVEVLHMIIMLIYMNTQFGQSATVDRCFANFNVFVGFVVQCFYFMGDSSFRRRLQEDGLLFALKKELF